MMLRISILLLITLSAIFAEPEPRSRIDGDYGWPKIRDNRRRPPPPFDTALRPHRPYPPMITINASEIDTSTSTLTPVVLYKINCEPCLPGWGIKSMCNEISPTVCIQCALGTWTPKTLHFGSCTPCSKCGDGLYEEMQCTNTRDTKCDSCSNRRAKINEDFMRKCDWWKTMDTSNADWDGRLDVEVVDLKEGFVSESTKDQASESDEFDEKLMSILTNDQEKDITMDDPKIDIDKTLADTDDDLLTEDDEEWRVLTMIRKETEQDDESNEDLDVKINVDKNENENEGVPVRPRPIRPLPQRMPVQEKTVQVDFTDDIVRPIERELENNYPPSYHSYPIDSLAHAGIDQRRKAIVLLTLASAIVLSVMAFIICYARAYCNRRTPYDRVLVVNLSPEEREIIRQSADKLETMDKPMKKYRIGGNGYSPIINAESQSSVYITENPLEQYLDYAEEGQIEKEILTENEVFEPVYRPTTTKD